MITGVSRSSVYKEMVPENGATSLGAVTFNSITRDALGSITQGRSPTTPQLQDPLAPWIVIRSDDTFRMLRSAVMVEPGTTSPNDLNGGSTKIR